MTYIITFDEFTPPPRFDGLPWTRISLEEGASESGPWTQIDSFSLNDLDPTAPGYDTDPEHPAEREFTTSSATLPSGWYLITFLDAQGGRAPILPIQRQALGEDDFLPTVTDVALEILSRTRDTYGKLAGTFNGKTTPTDTQVWKIILRVAATVADSLGDDIPEMLWDDAKKVIAMRAAMQVETSFFSDQVNTGRSIYPQLERQYEIELRRLQRQITMVEETGSLTPTDAGPSQKPSYSFPAPTDDLMTRRF